jgi:hypothetical protein
MKNDFARRKNVSVAREQNKEKRMRLFAREVMPALEEISPQPMQTAT